MLIIDRIVGDTAVCEGPGRAMVQLPLTSLPDNVREGDCLREESGAYVIDAAETQRRRQRNQDLFKRLLEQ